LQISGAEDALTLSRKLSPLIVACLAATWLIWGSTYLVIRFASEWLAGGAALLAMSALRGESWHWPLQAGPWLAWIYLTTFGSLIAFSAYMLLLARTSTSVAASYTLVNPVVALCLGVTVGRELVSAWEWLAAAVVMIGVVLLFASRRPALQ
jgi:drug/metabolite transporter (DMT)-like permease